MTKSLLLILLELTDFFFLKKRANLFIYFLFNKIKNIFILDIIWCTRATTEVSNCKKLKDKIKAILEGYIRKFPSDADLRRIR